MGLALDVITQLEQREVGLQWSNVADPLSSTQSFNVAWAMGFLLIDTILYMVLAWYV